MTSTLSNTSTTPFVTTHSTHLHPADNQLQQGSKTTMEKTTTHSNTPAPVSSSSGDEDSSHVTKLRENDVLLGRGGGTNNHAGNVKFRKMVNEHKLRYLAASR